MDLQSRAMKRRSKLRKAVVESARTLRIKPIIRGSVLLGLCLAGTALLAQQSARLELGRLQTGATVSFTRSNSGEWGIEAAGGAAPRIQQAKPAQVEVFRAANDIRELAAGYKTVRKSPAGIDAQADIPYAGNVVFHVQDQWSLSGAVLSVRRKVTVTGKAEGGFSSSAVLTVDPSVGWADVSYLAPGALYGDPSYDGERSPGSPANWAARRFLMREDIIPAPLFALSFENGASVAVLDPAPRGDTTVTETPTQPVMTDARFQFGALGAWQEEGPIEFGYRFPGATSNAGGGPGPGPQPADAQPAPAQASAAQPALRWVRRYHPISEGVAHGYQVSFRFGQNESFRDVTRNTWRWAWNTLKPPVYYTDIEQMRRVLTDHLVAQAATIDGRTAIPFVLSTVTDQLQWNWTMVAMGFVGKNIECADELLREGDRDKTERGQKMRQTGLAIISSLIQALPTVPLQGTGYDLKTGKPWEPEHEWLAPWLRNATEDMRVLMRAYRRERAQGRQHPEWFNWVKQYVDWLLQQQRADGSFPRRWKRGSNEVAEASGTTSYNPVPLLVLMSEETGDPKYKQSAIRAAEYVWSNWGTHGAFIGGAIDNPNITDKEAGMLSMEAYLSLYDSTKEPKWLERAKSAADFAESWILIWNIPMPADADDKNLHYKKGVPTVGIQGITAQASGGYDEYLDWAVPSYAKLYNLTKDEHYLDVARVLLHDTKSMVALPGRQYDVKGIGWQQEGWRMGAGSVRGVSGHRFWLPWVSANHLYGIAGLEEYDPALFKRLSTKPAAPQAKAK
jgi:hypothetical protein